MIKKPIVEPAALPTSGPGLAIESEYQAALASLKQKFDSDHKAVEKHFAQLYQDNTFLRREFFRKRFHNPNFKTKLTEKLAVISAARGGSAVSLSRLVLELIDRSNQVSTHTNEHDGFYRYWRHFPTDHAIDPVRWGVIKLETDERLGTIIKHWSFDFMKRELALAHKQAEIQWEQYTQPEDQGHAFFVRKRMFAMSFRDLNIRSIICSEPGGLQKKTSQIINGVMLTTRSTSGSIFSGGFVMVHQEHHLARSPLTLSDFEFFVKMQAEDQRKILFE